VCSSDLSAPTLSAPTLSAPTPSGHDATSVLGSQVSARPGTPTPSDDGGAAHDLGHEPAPGLAHDLAAVEPASEPAHTPSVAESTWTFDRSDRSRPVVVAGGGLDAAACEDAETIVRNDPWDLEALRRYGSCQALQGELANAASTFQRLLTFEPDNAGAEIGLAATQQELGEIAAAVEVYQRLLPHVAGDGEAARLRALLALAGASPGEDDGQGHR